jgi:hypothetical protein
MLIRHDEDEWELTYEHRTCAFHERSPGITYAGCTCMTSIGGKRRTPAEVAAIKASRRIDHEEAVLREAEEILRRRNTPRRTSS